MLINSTLMYSVHHVMLLMHNKKLCKAYNRSHIMKRYSGFLKFFVVAESLCQVFWDTLYGECFCKIVERTFNFHAHSSRLERYAVCSGLVHFKFRMYKCTDVFEAWTPALRTQQFCRPWLLMVSDFWIKYDQCISSISHFVLDVNWMPVSFCNAVTITGPFLVLLVYVLFLISHHTVAGSQQYRIF